MIKTLNKIDVVGTYNIVSTIYDKLTANLILIDEN